MPNASNTLDFWDEPLPAILLRRSRRVGLPQRRAQPMDAGARAPRLARRSGMPARLRGRASRN